MTINRIILHHTAGSHRASHVDKKAYHRIVEGDGTVVKGNHSISDNFVGRSLKPGAYAAHTLNLNSGSIGIALASMAGAVWNNPSTWKLPKPAQLDAFIREVSDLVVLYGIEVTPRHVLSHAEVEITLGVKQKGKWDFDYDPWSEDSTRDPIAIGNKIRSKVLANIADRKLSIPPPALSPMNYPVLSQGNNGQSVKDLQRMLNSHMKTHLVYDGIFGPATRSAVIAFQKAKKLLPDGIVGRMTWTALVS